MRGDKRQYVVHGPCGYPSWAVFEACELNQTDVADTTDATDATDASLDSLIEDYGPPIAGKVINTAFFGAYIIQNFAFASMSKNWM